MFHLATAVARVVWQRSAQCRHWAPLCVVVVVVIGFACNICSVFEIARFKNTEKRIQVVVEDWTLCLSLHDNVCVQCVVGSERHRKSQCDDCALGRWWRWRRLEHRRCCCWYRRFSPHGAHSNGTKWRVRYRVRVNVLESRGYAHCTFLHPCVYRIVPGGRIWWLVPGTLRHMGEGLCSKCTYVRWFRLRCAYFKQSPSPTCHFFLNQVLS